MPLDHAIAWLLTALVAFAFTTVPWSAAAADAAMSVRVGLPRESAISPLHVAAIAGYFAAEGLDVRLELLESAATIPAAVATGKLDFGVARLSGPYFQFAATHDVKIIAAHEGDQPGYPGNALAISKKAVQGGLRTWKDLPGRSVGLADPASGVHFAVAQIANKFGFDLRDVRLVWFKTPADAMSALASGRVDAALVPAVVALDVRSQNTKKTLRWIGDESPWQETVVVTSGRTIEKRREIVDRFLRAYRRGTIEYDETFLLRDDGADVIRGERFGEYLDVMAGKRNAGKTDLRSYLVPWADRLGRLDVSDISRQIRFWQVRRLVGESVSVESLVDLSFVEERH